jgi:integrase
MYEPILNVTKTMQRIQQVNGELPKTKNVISAPKSSYSVRKIPLPEEIYRLLQEQRRDSEAYLLTGECNRYVEPRSLENNFRKVLSNAGIGHMNYHALRHTFATRCIELGFDIKSLSEILGHSSVNITLNKYVHPTMELKQKNMNKLSDLFTDN